MTQRASASFVGRRVDRRACTGIARAAAVEPTAQAIEFYNASLDHYFVTAFPEEAAMLDAGTARQGLGAHGRHVQRLARRGGRSRRRAGVPLLRHARRRPELALLHRRRRGMRAGEDQSRLDLRGDRVPRRRCRKAARAKTGTQPVYRSFHAGRSVSQSNHRFLPDLTMHQKMASSSTLEGVVMCAPLSTRRSRPTPCAFSSSRPSGRPTRSSHT